MIRPARSKAPPCYNEPTLLETGATTLKVTIKLFASYRDKVGKGQIEWELPDGATVGCLADDIARRYALVRDPARLVVAVNEEYRDHAHVLNDGDEVALIPPVSGGADD